MTKESVPTLLAETFRRRSGREILNKKGSMKELYQSATPSGQPLATVSPASNRHRGGRGHLRNASSTLLCEVWKENRESKMHVGSDQRSPPLVSLLRRTPLVSLDESLVRTTLTTEGWRGAEIKSSNWKWPMGRDGISTHVGNGGTIPASLCGVGCTGKDKLHGRMID